MPSSNMRKRGYLRDCKTGCIQDKVVSDNPEENKIYAVILRCGHCGEGYFIPIMFTALAKDVYSAIETVKTNPRVQRQKKDVVLAVFEITPLERYFIDSVNNHDSYLKGYEKKSYDHVHERRVYSDSEEYSIGKEHNRKLDARTIKYADEYEPYYVLERTFAPRKQGNKIVPASRKINRDELIKEFFYQNTQRFGVKKANAFFLALYYQQYGKNNDLGLEYHDGYITFTNKGNRYTVEIRPETDAHLQKKIQEEQEQEKVKKEEAAEMDLGHNKRNMIDRFNRRMQKYKDSLSKTQPSETYAPEEGSEPGMN